MRRVSLVAAGLLLAVLGGCTRGYQLEPSSTGNSEPATASSEPATTEPVRFPILTRTVELADSACQRTGSALETVMESDCMNCAVTTVGGVFYFLGSMVGHRCY
jgi:hypothetical protein